jgi:hypothetical protein
MPGVISPGVDYEVVPGRAGFARDASAAQGVAVPVRLRRYVVCILRLAIMVTLQIARQSVVGGKPHHGR